jgi:Ni/Co efflux regulator RcnB
MRRLFSRSLGAAVAAALIGATAAQAQPYQPYPQGPGYGHQDYDHGDRDNHGPGYGPPRHDWHRGDRFYGDRNRVDWRYHHLHRPPRGYEWVQDGRQFVLIGIGTGVIAEILVNR